MRIFKFLPVTMAGAALVAAPAIAHHSGAMFDQTKLVTLEGTLVNFKLVQPHSWLTIDAKLQNSGAKLERWDVEASSTATMRRMGLTPDVLKPGAKMTLTVHPLRDGRRGGSLVSVVYNGKTYGSGYSARAYGPDRQDDGTGARVKER